MSGLVIDQMGMTGADLVDVQKLERSVVHMRKAVALGLACCTAVELAAAAGIGVVAEMEFAAAIPAEHHSTAVDSLMRNWRSALVSELGSERTCAGSHSINRKQKIALAPKLE